MELARSSLHGTITGALHDLQQVKKLTETCLASYNRLYHLGAITQTELEDRRVGVRCDWESLFSKICIRHGEDITHEALRSIRQTLN